MSIKLLFIHHREVRRLKFVEAESREEGEKLFEQFVESEEAGDDSAWDEIEDDDPGESELREIIDENAEVKELFAGMLVDCICRVCGAHVPVDDLRVHLATHHDGAWAFDTDQVWDSFEVRP